MPLNSVLASLQKRTRQFKRHGYDLPASRRFFWKVSGVRSGKVLEIGTGKGHLTALLAKKKVKAISIDLDGEALKTAGAHLSELNLSRRVSLRKMNAEKLAFPSRSFDSVFSMDFFHHAGNPLRCLKEMMRVARKNLMIADLNSKGLRIMDRIHRAEGKRHETPKVPFRELGRYLRKNGFIVRNYRHTCHQIYIAQRRRTS